MPLAPVTPDGIIGAAPNGNEFDVHCLDCVTDHDDATCSRSDGAIVHEWTPVRIGDWSHANFVCACTNGCGGVTDIPYGQDEYDRVPQYDGGRQLNDFPTLPF